MTLVSLLLLMQLHFMTGTVSGFAAQAASKPFDEGKFEADRLKKDAEAMDGMKLEERPTSNSPSSEHLGNGVSVGVLEMSRN